VFLLYLQYGKVYKLTADAKFGKFGNEFMIAMTLLVVYVGLIFKKGLFFLS